MITRATVVAAVAAIVLVEGQALTRAASDPPSTVPHVDLDRYEGRWYEIARFPNRFQRQCVGDVVVSYARRPDGRIDVLNTCRTADGTDEARGIAKPATDDGSNAKLKVRFAPAFLSWIPAVWGDYWVLALADDYTWAVVGDGDREYLWFLARAPQVDEATYRRLEEEAEDKGFDTSRLVRTKNQPSEG
jgi:apolipoprotein D and lipocalin family protein